ncbi:hypothetical protein FDP41_009894 [Naegleria fowleri]|uniref:RING-type domain-containing protein n=1 Tax=Naegleria fowleri TaxID=5763 RepID=A0A6A5B9L0_NAEFO|nr:uncharacterized protein FDP41_009894 [Naegleria fowleri]KAF0971671.1 hypothetical protein FDP41_009894 [Naegleria fowleri]CAG4718030.1 unnamed protein product [Naegleria fowleri]
MRREQREASSRPHSSNQDDRSKRIQQLPLELPLLVPRDKNFTCFHGFITLDQHKDHDEEKLELPCQVHFKFHQNYTNTNITNDNHGKESKKIQSVQILACPELQELLAKKPTRSMSSSNPSSSYEHILVDRLLKCHNNHMDAPLSQQCTNILCEMKNSLSQIHSLNSNTFTSVKKENSNLFNPGAFYKQFLKQVDEIGWNKVADLKVDLSTVTLCITDLQDRNHYVEVNTSTMETFAEIPPECQALVDAELSKISSSSNILQNDLMMDDNPHHVLSLSIIYDKYREIIEKLSDFFTVIEDFDEHLRVLEPEKPTRSHTMRRIVIGNHCSLQLQIDPFRPKERPKDIKLLGSDSIISPLRLKINQNRNKWDLSKLLRENLETVMETSFPAKKSADPNVMNTEDEYSENCGVCYSYRMNMKVPDKVCDNEKCSMPFHTECLIEWLRSIPGTHQSFDTMFGSCPYCSSPISVSIIK